MVRQYQEYIRIYQEEIVPSPSFCWCRKTRDFSPSGEKEMAPLCMTFSQTSGEDAALMRQLLGGWKTGCTVRKFVRSSLPKREVMANMSLLLLFLFRV